MLVTTLSSLFSQIYTTSLDYILFPNNPTRSTSYSDRVVSLLSAKFLGYSSQLKRQLKGYFSPGVSHLTFTSSTSSESPPISLTALSLPSDWQTFLFWKPSPVKAFPRTIPSPPLPDPPFPPPNQLCKTQRIVLPLHPAYTVPINNHNNEEQEHPFNLLLLVINPNPNNNNNPLGT